VCASHAMWKDRQIDRLKRMIEVANIFEQGARLLLVSRPVFDSIKCSEGKSNDDQCSAEQ
jgi:hypothetical protein